MELDNKLFSFKLKNFYDIKHYLSNDSIIKINMISYYH